MDPLAHRTVSDLAQLVETLQEFPPHRDLEGFVVELRAQLREAEPLGAAELSERLRALSERGLVALAPAELTVDQHLRHLDQHELRSLHDQLAGAWLGGEGGSPLRLHQRLLNRILAWSELSGLRAGGQLQGNALALTETLLDLGAPSLLGHASDLVVDRFLPEEPAPFLAELRGLLETTDHLARLVLPALDRLARVRGAWSPSRSSP